jgi:hypothetical protein
MKIEAANLFVIDKASNVPDRTGLLDREGLGSQAKNITQVWIACQCRSKLKNVSANRSKT